MGLNQDVKELSELLGERTRGHKWIVRVRCVTMGIHEGTWGERPARDYVRDIVLPLFQRVYQEGTRISDIISEQIQNLQRYVEGKSSDFMRIMVES